MRVPEAVRSDLTRLFALAWPVFLAQLAFTGLNVVDVWMAGRLSAVDMAVVGLGSNVMLLALTFGMGLLMVLSPMAARRWRQLGGSVRRLQPVLWGGLCVAALLGMGMAMLFAVLGWLLPQWLVHWMPDATPALLTGVRHYLWWLVPGMAVVFVFMALRFFWEGLGRTPWTLMLGAGGLVLNALLDAVLMWGIGDWSGLGGAGSALASTLVMLFWVVTGSWMVRRQLGVSLWRPDWRRRVVAGWAGRLVGLGLPSALTLFSEAALFMLLVFLIAPFGIEAVAAHQTTLSITSFLFVLPLSVALSLSILVSQRWGAGEAEALCGLVRTGLQLVLALGVLLGILAFFGRTLMAGWFSEDETVRQLAAALLVYAAFYQIGDALQMGSAAILRGLHRTYFTFWVTVISYWGIGLGGGSWLAWSAGMTVAGYWLGVTLALTFSGIVLTAWLIHVMKTGQWQKR